MGLLSMMPISHAKTYLPAETDWHEGTWLQWPHHYTYGKTFRKRLDATWIAITKALIEGEKVHIIAYNNREKKRISKLLIDANIPLRKIDFLLKPTDDFWVRDNGPIFVLDANNTLKITDWGFNGWGYDTPYRKDNSVPSKVARQTGIPIVNLNSIVLEGGSIEVDGNGTLMATRSAILEPQRNKGLSQTQLESKLRQHFGVRHFIWLDGAAGGKEDITDTHIDGFARFGNETTLVTMSNANLRHWGLSQKDISHLNRASNADGERYKIIHLPLTAQNVKTAYGKNLGHKGSYVNYYVANNSVLMPTYNDINDAVAKRILQSLYPKRKIVGIDARNLYRNGGMLHCVTQQQPLVK